MVVVVRFGLGLFHESERTCDPEIEKCSSHTQVINEQHLSLGPYLTEQTSLFRPSRLHCSHVRKTNPHESATEFTQ